MSLPWHPIMTASPHRALVLTSTSSPPAVKTLPTPQVTPGSAVVRVLAAGFTTATASTASTVGTPSIPDAAGDWQQCHSRMAAVGPDSTKLGPGQMVLVNTNIRSPDDPTGAFFVSGLHEGFTDGSRKLMHGEWRDSTFAEYAKVPLESCFVLNEKRLLGEYQGGGLGYQLESLLYIMTHLVPYGGLRDIRLQPGETPSSSSPQRRGRSVGAAVRVALAMGAHVIAL